MDEETRIAHMAAIVEGSDDAIASKDLRGIIRSWNPGAERMFGFLAKEAIGQPMTLIFPPDRISEESMILTRIAAGQRVDHYETIRMRKDGTLLDVSVTVSPIRDATGRVVGASKIARDITEAKRTERQMREANERLRQVDDERRTFLNLVAHELRTPLTPIMMQLELLRDTDAQGFYGDALSRMERNMGRLNSLIEQILTLARLEGGNLPLSVQGIDLAQLIEEAVSTFAESAARAGVHLEAHVPDPLPVQADPDRLLQIFTNLLSNAVKFTPPGGAIAITGAIRGGHVEVTVRDTGAGFPPELVRRLFQPFVRLDEKKPGTGLGLYISRAIALQHGGELSASSGGPGKGAAMLLTLPTASPASPAGERQPSPEGTAWPEAAPRPPPGRAAQGPRPGTRS